MSSRQMRKSSGEAPHLTRANFSKKQKPNFIKNLEVAASVLLFAVLGLMVAEGLVSASGNFQPDREISVKMAEVADGN